MRRVSPAVEFCCDHFFRQVESPVTLGGPESGQKKSRSPCQGGSWSEKCLATAAFKAQRNPFSTDCLAKGWVVREILDS